MADDLGIKRFADGRTEFLGIVQEREKTLAKENNGCGHHRARQGAPPRLVDSGRPGPEATLTVLHPSFFRQVLMHGEIGFGEAYQHRLCDSPDLVAQYLLMLDGPDLARTVDVHAHCIVPDAAKVINHPLEAPGLLWSNVG